MNCTVVHNDNRVRCRKGVHMLQETFDKLGKELGVERTLDDFAVKHAVKRDGWKNGIT